MSESTKITRAAVIDIGTSSLKLTIGEPVGSQIRVIEFLKTSIPIGKYTFLRGGISQEIIKQVVVILQKFKEVLTQYAVEQCKVIATTAVREARNSDIFIDTVLRKTGFRIEVLTVCDTIYYLDAYLSVKLENAYPLQEKKVLLAELGSGSLDVSVLNKGSTSLSLGLPVGTLRISQMRETLDGSLIDNYEAIRDYIEREVKYFKRLLPVTLDDVIVIDEKYSNYLFHILPEKTRVANLFTFTRQDAEAVFSLLLDKSSDEIGRLYRMPPDIAETIVPFCTVLDLLLDFSKSEGLYILETSLSEAVLANILLNVELSKKYDRMHQLTSIARYLCDKFHVDYHHAKQVAKLCKALFSSLRTHLGLEENHLLYLNLAAYLCELGSFIHNRAYHRHTEYIAASLNLFSLTEEEIRMIACIARYHRKAEPNDAHPLYGSLPVEKRMIIQKLSALLRVANALDISHKQKVERFHVRVDQDQDVTLVVSTRHNFTLERAEFLEKKRLYENITGNSMNLAFEQPGTMGENDGEA